MLSTLPDLWAVIEAMFIVTNLLCALGGLAEAYTFCRRCWRRALISQRLEGWGRASHHNQDLADGVPVHPVLESVKRLGRGRTTGEGEAPSSQEERRPAA